ncbi:MAG: tRNA (adenosine(37)-N6)-threonylcarbamoyltransferase complex dimerization subunit type 1 TsaB [Gemmatimonadaceae bacterium]|nr:tRNA (adenosine(37)-N6)-threonylcarbamoyltransferase complex dimerization subunit type 1 TsaB [Gemmatimonadaceae bacterium]
MISPADGFTLAIEASTYRGSVALLRGEEIMAARDVEMRGREQERLMPAVADCLTALAGGVNELDRVVCGAGPGSFTSLRIAASIAKGVCHARGIPLYAVSSLALIVASSGMAGKAGRYVTWLEAMRGEAFAAVFDVASDGAVSAAGPVRILMQSSLADAAREAGAARLDGEPTASAAALLLQTVLDAGPVDLAAWEPDYGRAAEAQVKWEAAHGRPLAW